MPGFLSTLRRLGITPEAIAAAVKRSKMPIVGGAGINVTSGPDIGMSISLLAQPRPIPAPIALVTVSAAASGGGKYTGFIWKTPTAKVLSRSGTLSLTEIGQTGDAIVIVNLDEVGKTTHDLTSGTATVTKFIGFRLVGVFSDDGKPVYVINGIDWEDCT